MNNKTIEAYNFFSKNDWSEDVVSKLVADGKWESVVNSSKEFFKIGNENNGVFKIIHWQDFKQNYDWSNTVKERCAELYSDYTYEKEFYFGSDYILLKK